MGKRACIYDDEFRAQILFSCWGPGTNENHNRIFRRFYPKGTDFSGLNPALFTEIQTWMNFYSRKIPDGSTPEKELIKYMGNDFKITL